MSNTKHNLHKSPYYDTEMPFKREPQIEVDWRSNLTNQTSSSYYRCTQMQCAICTRASRHRGVGCTLIDAGKIQAIQSNCIDEEADQRYKREYSCWLPIKRLRQEFRMKTPRASQELGSAQQERLL